MPTKEELLEAGPDRPEPESDTPVPAGPASGRAVDLSPQGRPWEENDASENMDLPEEFHCVEGRQVVYCDDVRQLGNRCRLDLGRHYKGVDAWCELPADYVITSTKEEMWSAFIPKYTNNQWRWIGLRRNIKADYQEAVPGLFWDDEHGYMNWAVMHALQLIGTTAFGGALGGTLNDLFEECHDQVIAGTLPVYLSPFGASMDGLLFVDEDGGVAAGPPSTTEFKGIAILEISLSPYYRHNAALADYLLWWAWRCHSYWKETGSGRHHLVGQSAARLALSECALIAGTIVHEFVHTQGYWPGHCRGSDPSVTLGLMAASDLAAWLATGTDPSGTVLAGVGSVALGAAAIASTAGGVEGFDCMMNTLQHGLLARSCTLNDLPMPLSYLARFDPTTEAADLAAAHGYVAVGGGAVGFWGHLTTSRGADALRADSNAVEQGGSWAWYEEIWGWADVVQGSGCDAATFTVDVAYDVKKTVASLEVAGLPADCRNEAAANATYEL